MAEAALIDGKAFAANLRARIGALAADMGLVEIEVINIGDASGSHQDVRDVELFFAMIPDFGHKETGKYLDGKM